VRAPILEAAALTMRFGGLTAVDAVTFTATQGDITAIIGPNGAGKTTFINMTTGYLKPNAGTIAYEGRPITGMSPRAIVKLGIARSFQLPQLFLEHTVEQNIALAIAAHHGIWSPIAPLLRRGYRDEARDLLARFGLSAIAQSRADALNEGARKLADIAMAVALKPRLLLHISLRQERRQPCPIPPRSKAQARRFPLNISMC
jgi:branched-chain amino acid transport system ATP-binding protein